MNSFANKPHQYSPFMVVAQGNPHEKGGLLWKVQLPGTGQLIGGYKSQSQAEKHALHLAGGVV